MTSRYSEQALREKIEAVPHWYHRVEVAPGLITPGVSDSASNLVHLDGLGLPTDCSGLRVLDLGARDGFFSFEMERRGAAEVVAIDYARADETGFAVLSDIFESRVRWATDNVYNVTPERYGRFDIVLCLGLLYHLRNPMLALDRFREVCTGDLFVESHVLDDHFVDARGALRSLRDLSSELVDVPIAQFHGVGRLNNDPTNWWSPTTACLERMLEATNFTVLGKRTRGNRATLHCRVNDDPEVMRWRMLDRGVMP